MFGLGRLPKLGPLPSLLDNKDIEPSIKFIFVENAFESTHAEFYQEDNSEEDEY